MYFLLIYCAVHMSVCVCVCISVCTCALTGHSQESPVREIYSSSSTVLCLTIKHHGRLAPEERSWAPRENGLRMIKCVHLASHAFVLPQGHCSEVLFRYNSSFWNVSLAGDLEASTQVLWGYYLLHLEIQLN